MPQKQKISRETILQAALNLVREAGVEALGARSVASRLGISTQPIFSQFANMQELKTAVFAEANALYAARVSAALASNNHPYRAAGLSYIGFAREEPQLFRWLFMRDRSIDPGLDDPTLDEILKLLQTRFGLSREDAMLFHLEMWVVVHGIATMVATSYFSWDEKTVARVLTDCYTGLLKQYGKELT